MSETYYNTIIWDKRKQKFNWYGLLLAKIKLNTTLASSLVVIVILFYIKPNFEDMNNFCGLYFSQTFNLTL